MNATKPHLRMFQGRWWIAGAPRDTVTHRAALAWVIERNRRNRHDG